VHEIRVPSLYLDLLHLDLLDPHDLVTIVSAVVVVKHSYWM
jgi:hypothetical protein